MHDKFHMQLEALVANDCRKNENQRDVDIGSIVANDEGYNDSARLVVYYTDGD